MLSDCSSSLSFQTDDFPGLAPCMVSLTGACTEVVGTHSWGQHAVGRAGSLGLAPGQRGPVGSATEGCKTALSLSQFTVPVCRRVPWIAVLVQLGEEKEYGARNEQVWVETEDQKPLQLWLTLSNWQYSVSLLQLSPVLEAENTLSCFELPGNLWVITTALRGASVNQRRVKMKFCLAEGISPIQPYLEESARIHQQLNLSGNI